MLFVIGLILVVPLTSAADWDNVKSYDTEKKEITITNLLGLGSDLAMYKLEKNTDYCLMNCYAEGKVILYEDGELFTKMIFQDRTEKTINIKEHKIYYEDQRETHPTPIYKEVCSDGKNGTVCELVQDGTTQTYEKYWKEYSGEIMPKGSYKWRIEGSKKRWESVDWIGTSFGVDLKEWAWWNSDYSFRRNITGLDGNLLLPINGTTSITINETETLIYGTGGVEPDLYFENNTLTAIANDTDEFFKIQTQGFGDLSKYSRTGNILDNLTFFMPFDNNITDTAINFVDWNNATLNNTKSQGRVFSGTNYFGGIELDGGAGGGIEYIGTSPIGGSNYITMIWVFQMAFDCETGGYGMLQSGGDYLAVDSPLFHLRWEATNIMNDDCTGWWDAGDWVHLVITLDDVNNKHQVFVNKVHKLTKTTAVNYNGAGSKIAIGGYATSGNMGGNMTHLEFYDRILTSAEINASFDRVTEVGVQEVPPLPQIDYYVGVPSGVVRYQNCSPDWEWYPAEPYEQDATYAAINATNNGSASGNFEIKYVGAIATNWTLYSCNATSADPDNDDNCITLTQDYQAIWTDDVAVDDTKKVWLYGNCSYVHENPGVTISMNATL